jgi:phage baseplate assembly protein W
MKYLKYPIDFNSLLMGNSKNFCEIHESIAHNIMMMIITSCGEIPEKPKYGSIIWDLEFDQHITRKDWEERVTKSLFVVINQNEKRLKLTKVIISLEEIEERELKMSIRRKANIIVEGVVKNESIPFYFNTKLNISPVSQ